MSVQRIGPSWRESFSMLREESMREQIRIMREALDYYAKPIILGSSEFSALVDVGGVARKALQEADGV